MKSRGPRLASESVLYLCLLTAACGEESASVPDGSVHDAAQTVATDASTAEPDAGPALDASLGRADAQPTPDAFVADAGPTFYSVGGSVTGLESGGTVTLRLNDEESLDVGGDGTYTFNASFALGDSYDVVIEEFPFSPPQNCSVANTVGVVAGHVEDIAVRCYQGHNLTVHSFGVEGDGLQLRNSDGQMLAIPSDGAYVFPEAIPPFSAFDVEVLAQPSGPAQSCSVFGGAGYASVAAHIDNIVVDCGESDIERLVVRASAGGNSGAALLRVFPGGIIPSAQAIIGGIKHPASPLAFFARAGATIFFGIGQQSLYEGAVSGDVVATPVDDLPADSGQAQGKAYLSSNGDFIAYRQLYFEDGASKHRLRARDLQGATTGTPEAILDCDDSFRCADFGAAGNHGIWLTRNFVNAFDQVLYFVPRVGGVWGAPVPLTTERANYSVERPIVSPDGRWLAFWGLDGVTHDIWISVVDVSGAAPVVHPLITGTIEHAAGPDLQLSEDGRWLVYDQGGDIYAADLEAPALEMTQVVSTSATFISPALAPSGSKLVYEEGGALYLYDLAMSSPSTLIGNGRGAVWHPSGAQFAYMAPGSTLFLEPQLVADVQNPTPVPLAFGEYQAFFNGRILFIGEDLVAVVGRSTGDLDALVKWDLENPGLEPAAVGPSVGGVQSITLSSVLKLGDTWFFERGTNSYWRYNETTGEGGVVPWFAEQVVGVFDRIERGN